MIISIVVFFAERLGWTWLVNLLKPKAPPAVPADPTPVAQAKEVGVTETKLQTTDTANAQADKATVARTKADVAVQRDSAGELRNDPFDLDGN